MKRKKYLFIITGIILVVTAAIAIFCGSHKQRLEMPAEKVLIKKYETLNEYMASINRSCQIDNDCVIKDVRNCCGAYPQCVNARAQVDLDFVRQACEKEGVAGVCGYPAIDSCKCVNSKCQGVLKNDASQFPQ